MRAKALVVDSDPSSRFALERALARRGHVATLCADIEAARGALSVGRFDLAIVDAGIIVPTAAGRGDDLVFAWRREFPKMPIVVMARPADIRVAQSALARGAAELLAKPFSLDQLDELFDAIDKFGSDRRLDEPPTPMMGDRGEEGPANPYATTPADLGAAFATAVDRQFGAWGGALPADLYDVVVRTVERPLFLRLLADTRGNQLATAAILGLNRNTLRKKLRYLGLLKPRTH